MNDDAILDIASGLNRHRVHLSFGIRLIGPDNRIRADEYIGAIWTLPMILAVGSIYAVGATCGQSPLGLGRIVLFMNTFLCFEKR
jgi:hypothetical protein